MENLRNIGLVTKIISDFDEVEEGIDLFVIDGSSMRDMKMGMDEFDKQLDRVGELVRELEGDGIKQGELTYSLAAEGYTEEDLHESTLVYDMIVDGDLEANLEDEIEYHGMTATMDLDDLDSFVVYDQPHTIIEPDYEAGLINRTVVHEGKSNVDVIKMDSRSGKQLLQLSGLPLKG